LTNLTVLFSHAVPVLRQVLTSPDLAASVSLKPADNFPHDKSSGPVLLGFASGYDRQLAHLIVLSVFSYFEAYIRGALQEVFDLQGGEAAFVTLARRRVTRNWKSLAPDVIEAKRKLQTREKKGKADKYRKYGKFLADSNFAFPPELFAAYGAHQLARKLETKGRAALRAHEIPDLVAEALLLEVTKSERNAYEELRELRNKIAHGGVPTLTVHQAVKKTTFLRQWAARIDQHIGEYFLVLAKHAF
jgi:hypothetical protein